MKWWSRRVTLPHELACRASALLVCHDPVKLAGRLGAAPSGLSFGDSAAQAGARPAKKLVRLPGMGFPSPASWVPQMGLFALANCSAPGHPPWRGGILAVKSQPRKLKGPEASRLPAHAISTKNKHLLAIYSIPARGFTAAVSVFRGTPPPKPFNCESVSNRPGAPFRLRWAEPTGEESPLLRALLGLAVTDILKTSFGYCSQIVTFRCCRSRWLSR